MPKSCTHIQNINLSNFSIEVAYLYIYIQVFFCFNFVAASKINFKCLKCIEVAYLYFYNQVFFASTLLQFLRLTLNV